MFCLHNKLNAGKLIRKAVGGELTIQDFIPNIADMPNGATRLRFMPVRGIDSESNPTHCVFGETKDKRTGILKGKLKRSN